MLNINFIPDDYIQNNESRRTNLLYLGLLVVVMCVLVGSFVTIKIRQRVFSAEEKLISAKMAQVPEAIKQFEELQTKHKAMFSTVLTAVDLLEPVPRSALLASLTNNLPTGVSLLRLKVVEKAAKKPTQPRRVETSKYKAEQDKKAAAQLQMSKEKLLETHIDIEGIAPSDLEVAAYIEQLSDSVLLDNVTLVESKEHKVKDIMFRQFKLKAMLKKGIHFTSEDVKKITERASRG